MSPSQLSEYLQVLRDHKVMSGRVCMDHIEINVVFAPDELEMPGEAPSPGGWKGPEKLDDHSVFEMPSEPGRLP